MLVLAAPIQEYTEAAFRNAHSRVIGGIEEYYMPFIRLEHGGLTKRTTSDLAPANNASTNVVPQLLVKEPDETSFLLEKVRVLGYTRIDFNFGCPFPKVVKSGYGAGILPKPQAVRTLLTLATQDNSLRISVKMRLGLENREDWRNLLPVLNDFPLDKIVLHPRTASEQYDGTPDREAFLAFRESCHHPLFFNGDIREPVDAKGLEGVMLGRGLLANPLLPRQLNGETLPASLLVDFHSAYVEECQKCYQQPLLKLKLFWDYFLPDADKRLRKAIKKSVTLDEYLSLTAELLQTIVEK